LLLYLFCFGHCLCLLSLEPCHLNYKNHTPLPNTEQEAAGLIWRLVRNIRVARLVAPGAHFRKFVAYWIVLLSRIVSFVFSGMVYFFLSCITLPVSSRVVEVFLVAHRFVVAFAYDLVLLDFLEYRVPSSRRFAYYLILASRIVQSSFRVPFGSLFRVISSLDRCVSP